MGNENWCMIGYHSVSVLADAITKGLPIDKQEAVKAMVSSSNVPYYDHTDEYKQLGYVPFDQSPTSASITLENAYEDWTVYHTALLLGDKESSLLIKLRFPPIRRIRSDGACGT